MEISFIIYNFESQFIPHFLGSTFEKNMSDIRYYICISKMKSFCSLCRKRNICTGVELQVWPGLPGLTRTEIYQPPWKINLPDWKIYRGKHAQKAQVLPQFEQGLIFCRPVFIQRQMLLKSCYNKNVNMSGAPWVWTGHQLENWTNRRLKNVHISV